jgi:hypothetical protein
LSDATTAPEVGDIVSVPSALETVLTLAPVVLQVGQEIAPVVETTIGAVPLAASVPPRVGHCSEGVPAAACAVIVAAPVLEPLAMIDPPEPPLTPSVRVLRDVSVVPVMLSDESMARVLLM